MRSLSLLFLLILASFSLKAQNSSSKYWIFFKDKNIQNQQVSLSPDALWNRYQQGIAIDNKDYPVDKANLQRLTKMGISPIRVSRWLNAVSVWLTPFQVQQLSNEDFVANLQPVAALKVAHEVGELKALDSLDYPKWQLDMIGTSFLHSLYYSGKGVKIAMMDNGFIVADTNFAMRPIFEQERILDTYDFVDNDKNVFEFCGVNGYCRHGAWCFSLIGGKVDSVNYSGSAPDAQFMLFRTENDASETSQEEDNWVAAAERADSLGAQVFSTSLGYSVFDDTATSYHPYQMDGNTAIITKAADIAASKGIIVVNSAGNEGAKPWRTLLAPADGDSVLAIGSVNKDKKYSWFSSQGYSADGRVKPDVMTLGEQAYLVDINGKVFKGNGTSFACPIMSGTMACLRQMYPKVPTFQLQEWVKQSADRYNTPDSLYGYGIPNMLKLLNAHTPPINTFQIAPNPNDGTCIAIWEETTTFDGNIAIFDLTGRKLYYQNYTFSQGWNRVPLSLNYLTNGLYPVVIQDNKGNIKYQSKLLIRR